MHVSEIEPLYWHMEDALLQSKTDRAQACFGLLLYAAKHNPRLIAAGLRQEHRDRLKEISFEMTGQSVPVKRDAISIKTGQSPVSLPFKKERELQEFLLDHPETLSQGFGESVKIVGTEVETDCGYRCDIVAESKLIFYPIELKIGQANHQVVSQCSKYCFYFYRRLRYNHFKKIQGIVIANGADSWSINELRRMGIWVFLLRAGSDGVILNRVE